MKRILKVEQAHQKEKCVIVVTHSKELASCMDVQLKIDVQKLKVIE